MAAEAVQARTLTGPRPHDGWVDLKRLVKAADRLFVPAETVQARALVHQDRRVLRVNSKRLVKAAEGLFKAAEGVEAARELGPGREVLRVDLKRVVKTPGRFLITAQVIEVVPLPEPGGNKPRVNLQRLVVAVDRLRPPFQAVEAVALVPPGRGMEGIKAEGLVAAFDGLLVAADAAQAVRLVVPGRDVCGVELEDAVAAADRLVVAAEAVVSITLIVPGGDVLRGDLDCLRVAGDCLLVPAQAAQGRSLVVPRRRQFRRQLDGLFLTAQGLIVALESVENHPFGAPGLPVLGNEFNNPVETADGLFVPAQDLQARRLVVPLPELGHVGGDRFDRLAVLTLEQRLEFRPQRGKGREAPARLLLQTALDDGRQRRVELRHRHFRVQSSHLAPEAGRLQGSGGQGDAEREPAVPGDLEQHDAERVDVAAFVAGLGIPEQLRCHVGRRAVAAAVRTRPGEADGSRPGNHLSRRHFGRAEGGRHAEVGDSDRLVGTDHDVGGFDIPVAADALGVGVLNTPAELDGPAQPLREVGRPLAQVPLKRVQTVFVGRHVLEPDEQPSGDVDDVAGPH